MDWISVKYRLPEFHKPVLCVIEGFSTGRKYMVVMFHVDSEDEVWRIEPDEPFNEMAFDVTHWMPLPEPPKD